MSLLIQHHQVTLRMAKIVKIACIAWLTDVELYQVLFHPDQFITSEVHADFNVDGRFCVRLVVFQDNN